MPKARKVCMEANKNLLHDSVEGLYTSLEKLKELYQAYLEIAREQRQALINHNLTKNQQLNRSCESILEEMSYWERNRQEKVEKLASYFEVPIHEGLRLDDIAVYLERKTAEKLFRTRAALKEILQELRRVLHSNQALAENGRKVIQKTFSIITSTKVKPDKNPGVYGSGGRSVKDNKQSHQLVNYKV